MMIAPIVARRMAELGWTQRSIREFLWENSQIPMAQMKRWQFRDEADALASGASAAR